VTWIKICGTTNERDADIAIRAGANALGFIMTKSPRQVSDTAAYSIGTIVPKGVETIGVFVDEQLETLVQTARFCRFAGVQLHGDEDAEYVSELRRLLPGIRVVKATTATTLDKGTRCKPDAWLLDSPAGAQRGGTGKTFDWRAAQPSIRSLQEPVILAGGLNAQNVQSALEILQPWGVDVASGVESYPGRKHPGLVTQFIDAVRQFDAHARAGKTTARKGQRV
jgi:phosphoribosylanthranilate isomerase